MFTEVKPSDAVPCTDDKTYYPNFFVVIWQHIIPGIHIVEVDPFMEPS